MLLEPECFNLFLLLSFCNLVYILNLVTSTAVEPQGRAMMCVMYMKSHLSYCWNYILITLADLSGYTVTANSQTLSPGQPNPAWPGLSENLQ